MTTKTKAFEICARGLRQFGYADVTPQMIGTAHAKWVAGKPMDGIIEMMASRQFEEHPELFGTPDGEAA